MPPATTHSQHPVGLERRQPLHASNAPLQDDSTHLTRPHHLPYRVAPAFNLLSPSLTDHPSLSAFARPRHPPRQAHTCGGPQPAAFCASAQCVIAVPSFKNPQFLLRNCTEFTYTFPVNDYEIQRRRNVVRLYVPVMYGALEPGKYVKPCTFSTSTCTV